MQTSLEWLSDFLDPVPPVGDAGEALTMGGYPVEATSNVGGVDVMDVEITSNRPDLLCHVGVAREFAALTGGRFSATFKTPKTIAEKAADATSVSIERPDLCPHYTARILRNVTVGPSPDWMRRRLEQVGLRPINNVVDVTNYVLYELGQPLHAFDFDQLAGGRIVVRAAREGEQLTTLDGVDRTLTSDMLVIADADKPAALAGVMGGEFSEVTAGTTTILLESARFDPLSVRKTSRRLKLMSDSSYRFERGLDPTLAERASLRACELILQTAGGELLDGHAEAGTGDVVPDELALRLSEMKRILGVDLPPTEVAAALDRLGFAPSAGPEAIEVTVPTHRLDVSIEADLIEEAARVVGYDKIPLRERIEVVVKPVNPEIVALDAVRDALTAAGYFEAVTFSFVSDALQSQFLPDGAKLRRVDPNVRKADSHLRPSVLPGLLEALRYNETVGNGVVKLFESGSAFWRDSEPVERRRIALVGADYAGCRGAVELLLSRLDNERPVRVEPAAAPGFARGVCGRVIWGDADVGVIGVADRRVAESLSLDARPAMAELDLEPLFAGYQPVPTNRPLGRFPAARRDVSLLVDEAVTYAALARLAEESGLNDLEAIEHGGTYRGKPLSAGTKSITLSLSFRRPNATVPREATEAEVATFVEAARAAVGAEQRS